MRLDRPATQAEIDRQKQQLTRFRYVSTKADKQRVIDWHSRAIASGADASKIDSIKDRMLNYKFDPKEIEALNIYKGTPILQVMERVAEFKGRPMVKRSLLDKILK